MLVLSCKQSQRILIGENIVITITEIRPDKVKIGVDAPGNVSVHREEVYHAIKKNGPTNRKIEG